MKVLFRAFRHLIPLLLLGVLVACTEKAKEASIADAEKALSGGDYTAALTISKTLVSIDQSRPQAHVIIARVKARQGDVDGAIDSLEAALTSGLVDKSVVMTASEFLSLTQHPRFLMMVEQYGISQGSESQSDGASGTRIRAGDIEIEIN
jgi:hypothetical protein